MRTTMTAALLLAATLAAACKVSVSTGGDEKLGTFTCADVKDGACVGPADTFPATAPIVHLYFRSTDLPRQGDTYQVAWIAEDVGEAAPPNTEIATVPLEVKEPTVGGANYLVQSQLTRPTNGWPVGKYRVEVKRADKLVTTARFTIK